MRVKVLPMQQGKQGLHTLHNTSELKPKKTMSSKCLVRIYDVNLILYSLFYGAADCRLLD